MDVFNALWDNPEQRKRPSDDNFQLFTTEDWLKMSSTHKILSGSLTCPLPPEIELPDQARKAPPIQNERNKPSPKPQGTTVQNACQSENMEKIYVPGLAKFPQLHRVSSLTSIEQRDCLNLLLKFRGKDLADLSLAEKAEYQLFESLYSRVKEEQKEYLQLAELDWPQYVIRCCRVRGDPHNFFLQHWRDKVTRFMTQYSKNYKRLKMVTLERETVMTTKLHFIKNILNLGKIPNLYIPDFKVPYRITTSLLKLRSIALLHLPVTQLQQTLHKIPVSKDPNAERLARLHGADIVISTSGWRCLLDNFDEKKNPPSSGIGKSWTLPVIVKEHRSFCNGKPVTKTIIFIDKTLPKPKMTSFEKVSWYQKRALFSALVKPFSKEGIEFEIKGEDIFVKKYCTEHSPQHLPQEACSETTIEGFVKEKAKAALVSSEPTETDTSSGSKLGEEQSSVSDVLSNAVPSPINSSISQDDGDDSSDDNMLQIIVPEDEAVKVEKIPSEPAEKSSPCMKLVEKNDTKIANMAVNTDGSTANKMIEVGVKKESIGKPTETSDSTSIPSKAALPSQTTNKWGNVPAAPPVKVVNGNALPISTTNLTYNMWCLQPQADENVKNEVQSKCGKVFNILIRSRVDGCESGTSQPLSIANKPDFQLEYGPAVVPLSDLTRQWAKLVIQPDSRLARVRVNVHSAEMIKLEKLTVEEVEQEAQNLYKEKLTDTLKTLLGVFSELKKLPLGEYLLSHSPEMGLAAELFQKTVGDEAVDFNLVEDYRSLPQEIQCDVPWQRIDPTIVMPKNLHFKCMPCTFHSPKGPMVISKRSKPQPVKFITAYNAQKKKKKKSKGPKEPVVTTEEVKK